MSKFEDIVYKLQQDIEVPENVWGKYTGALSELPDKPQERPLSIISKKRMLPVAAAAALVIGTISISAAAHIQWSSGLEKGLQTTPEQRQELEDIQMASFVEQSVTQGEVTVTAKQSIVDNNFAYLSFKVEGYKVEDGMEPGFSGVNVVVGNDMEQHSGGWNASFYNGLVQGADGKVIHDDGSPLTEGERESYIMEDGSMEFQIMMMSDKKGSFIDKPIHVELKDLGTYKVKAGDILVDAEGEWNFDWVLTGSSEMEKYELNTRLEETGAAVVAAELSPISVSITFDFPRQQETEKGIDENGEEITLTTYKEPPYFTGVRLKDGTIYTGIAKGGISGYTAENSDIYEHTAALNRMIDVEQVESLLFIKSCPEGEQPLTEEHLYFVPVKTE